MAAKEIAIGKRAKISEAQQYMLLAVLGAAVVLGVAICLTVHFIKQIDFNVKVIMAEDESIVAYSNVIEKTGICKKPKGDVYSDEELNKCYPDSIEVSEIPDTLRANILEIVAANEGLNSVPKETDSACVNQETGKNYTYEELKKAYDEANNSEELVVATQRIKSCSALRIIPDALPSYKNEEALLASLNKLFLDSGYQPDSLSPADSTMNIDMVADLNPLSVNLSIEGASSDVTMNLIKNIEHSIREFDISRATIEWRGTEDFSFRAQATAYYIDKSVVNEINKKISAEGGR